jgi:hypothetical protein
MSGLSRVSARAAIAARAITATSWCLAGAVLATVLLAACGTAGPSQSATAPTTAAGETSTASLPPTTSLPGTPAPTWPAPASPSPTGSGAAGLTACRTASLLITVDNSQAGGAAGSAYYPLNFTNKSPVTCELYGYPGVSFVSAPDGTGRQIGVAAQRSRTFTKMAVRLAPGGTAHAWLQVTVAANYPASSCQPVTAYWLRVYPPGETVPGYVDHTFNACSSTSTALLTVLPVRAGQGLAGITP